MKLSPNFSLIEFERNMTATRMGIDNTIPEDLIPSIQHLVNTILQPLRDIYGKPIRIASGYRVAALNSYIGGATHSQHMQGRAADIDTVEDNMILFDLIMKHELPYDQFIFEFGKEIPEWVHVSAKQINNRGEVLRAYRDEHGVHYSPFLHEVKDA